jgi:hypothetical protein
MRHDRSPRPRCRWVAVLLVGCAWMLWERSWSSIGKIGNQWEVAGAYETQQACEAVRPEKIRQSIAEYQELAKAVGGKVTRRDDVVFFVYQKPEPTQMSTTYMCLPDTIDPRSSKP